MRHRYSFLHISTLFGEVDFAIRRGVGGNVLSYTQVVLNRCADVFVQCSGAMYKWGCDAPILVEQCAIALM